MSDQVSRRGAIRALATGAALAAGGTTAAKVIDVATPEVPALSEWALSRTREVAQTTGRALPPRVSNVVHEAQVFHCRSWDSSIYLYIDSDTKGFVHVNAQAFAMAVACQAAGRKVFAQVWGHEPEWASGTGRFAGVLLAMDKNDFPG